MIKRRIPHQVLNAKYHEKEAEIIAQAGKYKAVTIATNMAGRGTDIVLGGNSEYLAKQEMRNKYTYEEIEEATAFNETDDKKILARREEFRYLVAKYDKGIEDERQKVIDAGGLKIIVTERHESGRIDNQVKRTVDVTVTLENLDSIFLHLMMTNGNTLRNAVSKIIAVKLVLQMICQSNQD